jgi:hypothetical protein
VLTFLRNATNKVPALAVDKIELLSIVNRTKELADVRNDVLHGYLSEYHEARDHLLIFRGYSSSLSAKSCGALAELSNFTIS